MTSISVRGPPVTGRSRCRCSLLTARCQDVCAWPTDTWEIRANSERWMQNEFGELLCDTWAFDDPISREWCSPGHITRWHIEVSHFLTFNRLKIFSERTTEWDHASWKGKLKLHWRVHAAAPLFFFFFFFYSAWAKKSRRDAGEKFFFFTRVNY